jgi:sugar phosphate isomerase/epimerase
MPTRRDFIKASGATVVAGSVFGATACRPAASKRAAGPPLRLGLVTYNLAKDWDVETLIKNCTETGFEAVELRTTHAHGVEVELTDAQRMDVRRRFEDSAVELASLGSAFEYNAPDPEELRRHIEGTKAYSKLAHDVGARGIKVRPNRLHVDDGVPEEVTLRQIGDSLREVGQFASDYGVEIRVEVHGRDTSRLPRMKKIMDYADHDNVFVCWNSNQNDLEDGGLEANFDLVKDRIRFVHMRDLYLDEYPWRRMLGLLRGINYTGFCCAEIGESPDPLRVMRYYRSLFLALQDVV